MHFRKSEFPSIGRVQHKKNINTMQKDQITLIFITVRKPLSLPIHLPRREFPVYCPRLAPVFSEEKTKRCQKMRQKSIKRQFSKALSVRAKKENFFSLLHFMS